MLVGENPLFSAKRKILERAGKREMKREYYELPARKQSDVDFCLLDVVHTYVVVSSKTICTYFRDWYVLLDGYLIF